MSGAALVMLAAAALMALIHAMLLLSQAYADTGGGIPNTSVTPDLESDRVGATAAQFRVDESGAATYSIPLYAVPGTAGVTPQLSLNYSSQGGTGPIGKGWSLGGLSSIVRCRMSRESGDFIANGQPFDGTAPAVGFTATDRYCLDGQRLLPAQAGSTACPAINGMGVENLRTEVETFQRVCAYTPSGGATGVAFFTVERKDGSTSWYGDRATSATQDLGYNGYVNSTAPGKEAFALAWSQTRFQDSSGNYIDYVYSRPTDVVGEQLLDEVRFTGKVALAGQSITSAPYAKLKFNYIVRPASGQAVSYVAGGKVTQSRLLESITSCASLACAGPDQVRHYQLGYGLSASNSGLETLTSIRECRDATGAVCLPATTFEWSQAVNQVNSTGSWQPQEFGSASKFRGFKLADVDGDGRQDMVWLKQGHGGDQCAMQHVVISWGGIGNNGYQGFNGASVGACSEWDLSAMGDQSWQLFDYDGDGRDDLFMVGANGAWVLYPSQGRVEGTFNKANNRLASINIPVNGNPGDPQPVMADLNGDGLLDVMYITGGTTVRARVSGRAASGFQWGPELQVVSSVITDTKTCNGWECYLSTVSFSGQQGAYQLLDFDGDNRSDLRIRAVYTAPDPGCAFVATSGQQSLTARAPASDAHLGRNNDCWPTKTSFGWLMRVVDQTATTLRIEPYANNAPSITKTGDFNGDGLTDIIGTQADGQWVLYLNTGTGFAAPTLIGAFPHPTKVNPIDFTGDGRADLVYLDVYTLDMTWRYFMRRALPNGTFGAPEMLPGAGTMACLGASCDPDQYVNMFADLDGDGAVDYFALQIADSAKFFISQGLPADRGKPRDVIMAVRNGLGARTELTYAPLTNAAVYRRDSGTRDAVTWGRASPVQDFIAPIYVVAKAASSSPLPGNPGAMASLYYRYIGAKVQAGGRGFLGFREVATIDPNQSGGYVVTTTRYRQDFPFVGMALQTRRRAFANATYQPDPCVGSVLEQCYATPGAVFPEWGGVVFSDSVQGWSSDIDGLTAQDVPFAPGIQAPVQVLTDTSDELAFDPVTGAATNAVATYFTYGAHGNALTTRVKTYTGANALVSDVRTDNVYTDSPANWRLGRLTRSVVTHSRPGVPDIQRVTEFAYAMTGAATGQLLEERTDPNGSASTALRKVYTLDEFGNRTGVTTCSGEVPVCAPSGAPLRPSSPTWVQRFAYTNYDARGRFALATVEPFGSGNTSVMTASTGTIVSRNVFGDVTQAYDANGVDTLAVTGTLGRPYYKWVETVAGGTPGSSSSGVSAFTTYRLCAAVDCPAGAVFREKTTATQSPTSWTWFDALGRPILKATESFNVGVAGADVSAVCTEYDLVGRPKRVSNPFFLPGTAGSDGPTGLANVCATQTRWQATTFDLLGRPLQVQAADQTTLSTAYNGNTTVSTDQRGKTTTQYRNGLGEVTMTVDALGGVMANYYYADGALWAVHRDAAPGGGSRGLVVNAFAYDALGRKVLQDDQDAGLSQYQYNALGELLVQTDADGNSVQNAYDIRGRVWRRTVTDRGGAIESQSTFSFESSASVPLGAMDREEITGRYASYAAAAGLDLSFVRTTAFDALGRPSSSVSTIDGAAYSASTSYDSYGRPWRSKDASGNWVKVEYGARGLPTAACLSTLTDAKPTCLSSVFQRTLEMDAWGHTTRELRSSSGQMEVRRTYDPVDGRLRRLCADSSAAGDCDLMDEAYVWDAAGNLNSHAKENRYLETFSYDDLNRLRTGTVTQGGTTTTTQAFDYDLLGNICRKQSLGVVQDYTYVGRSGCGVTTPTGGGGSGPYGAHQAYQVGGAFHYYDTRGNLTFKDLPGLSADRSVKYSRDGKPYEISVGDPLAPGARSRVWYGPDGQRYKTHHVDQGETVLYLGNVEVVKNGAVTTYRRYLGGVLLQTRVGSAVTDQYLFHDQLGSVVRITDAMGVPQANQDYTAFGERRAYASVNTAGSPPAATPRGFTGHEHFDRLGIIHMNGRIFDPGVGRFLQPDPVIQSPGNSQSWNAYTYVFNNPYVYTDPTGLWGAKEQQTLRMVAALVISIWTGGAASGWWGYSLGTTQAFACVTLGAFAAGVVGSNGSLRQGLVGAFGAALTFGISRFGGDWGAWQIAAQAFTGGIVEYLQGGNFGHGFAAAGLTALMMPAVGTIKNDVARTAVGALVGGTISQATGGKFANGAVTGAVMAAMSGSPEKSGFASDNAAEKTDLSDVPSDRLRKLMTSKNPRDRIAAAKAAADHFGIDDSGITYGYNTHPDAAAGTMSVNGEMFLGGKAFTSWARLGSTLGHEIEVHWTRQYVGREWDDRPQRLWAGEYEAYKYNIQNASRFGNTAQHVEGFRYRMNEALRNLNAANRQAVLGGHYDRVY